MEIKDRGEPLSEQALQELEEKLGVSLPEPYRRFLQEYNGGQPGQDAEILDIAGAPFVGADVKMFFGARGGDEPDDLLSNKENLSGAFADHLLPIANDHSGSVYCIVTRGKERGYVYYLDYYANWEPYFIAEDFDSFLQQLRAWTPEELAEMDARAAADAAADAAAEPDEPDA